MIPVLHSPVNQMGNGLLKVTRRGAGPGVVVYRSPCPQRSSGKATQINPVPLNSTHVNLHLLCIVRAGNLTQMDPVQLENGSYEPVGVQETKHHHGCYRGGVWGALHRSGESYSAPGQSLSLKYQIIMTRGKSVLVLQGLCSRWVFRVSRLL